MQTINVRELRSTIPRLRETLERERELLLVSNGEPIARILPISAKQELERPRLQSLKWLRDLAGTELQPDSTAFIREDRDRRGT